MSLTNAGSRSQIEDDSRLYSRALGPSHPSTNSAPSPRTSTGRRSASTRWVAKKRLLIERLEEYRTALITRTVTRGLPPEAARAAGLDPSPRLKPSGVEWLGEVPEHWEVQKHPSCTLRE